MTPPERHLRASARLFFFTGLLLPEIEFILKFDYDE
jgi:hypothetical protein